jgi:hypothetical protein
MPEASVPNAFARPKSSNFLPVRVDLDVRGLEIAMNDALRVRGLKCGRDLCRDRQRLVEP